jgi:transposase
VRTYKVSRDPAFAEKVNDVVGLYLSPPTNAIVLSVDEKTSIQALERTQLPLPLRTGRAVRHTHDYKRHGVVDLFAALEVATGQVTHELRDSHTGADFLGFMKKVVARYPKRLLHVILDNSSTHSTPEIRDWPAKNRNVQFHYTPTSASWLNQVEGFFGILGKQSLGMSDFPSKRALRDHIAAYMRAWNDNPTPFEWTKPAGAIIRSHRRMLDRISRAGALVVVQVQEILDCNGYHIIDTSNSTFNPPNCGPSANLTCGIKIVSRDNVTVQHCSIVGGFGFGMWVNDTFGTNVNDIFTNSDVGYRYEDVVGPIHYHGDVHSNSFEGMELRRPSVMTIDDTWTYYTGSDGSDEETGDATWYLNGSTHVNGTNGYECDGCYYAEYRGNYSYDNGQHGITLDDDNMTGAGNFLISGNYVANNVSEQGIRIDRANNGAVSSNTSTGHTCDLRQTNSSGNTWSLNAYMNLCGVPPH